MNNKNSNRERFARFALGSAFVMPLLLVSSTANGPEITPPPPAEPEAGGQMGFKQRGKHYPKYHGIILAIDDEEMLERVKEALDLMKEKAPQHFNFVQAYIKQIRQADRSGMHVREGIFDLNKNSVTQPEWTASIIFHDSVHRYQYLNGLPYFGEAGETDASTRQLAFLELIEAPQFLIDHLKNVIAHGDHSDLNGDGQYTHEDYIMRTWVRPQPGMGQSW